MKTVRNAALLLAFLSFATAFAASTAQAGPIVCVETNLDSFCMELLDTDAPVATSNFLSYVDSGAYDNSLIHMSARRGYLLGGQYKVPLPLVTTTVTVSNSSGIITSTSTSTATGTYSSVSSTTLTPADSAGNTTSTAVTVSPSDKLDAIPVTTNAPIVNEFKLPNTRGTIAFTTLPGQPNSATSGFRINVADNTGAFPNSSNSGAVFARIIGSGMDVVDRLSKLTTHKLFDYSYLTQAPMLKLDNKVTADDLVQIKRVYRYPGGMAEFNQYGIAYKPVSQQNLQSVVCFTTNIGEMCFKLYPEDAPATVANFLKYVNRGSYDGTFVHRLATNFVLQGGGYSLQNGTAVKVTADAPIANEYKRSNTYGTIAMAKLNGDPNSATTEWFINIADNTTVLGPSNNGGFTVFGELIPSSLTVLNQVFAATPTNQSGSLGAAFDTVPVVYDATTGTSNNFITISKAFVTERDVSTTTPGPTGPLANVQTLGTYLQYLYTGAAARFPIRMNNKMYMMVMGQDLSNGDPNLFNIDTTHIIELIDNGRIAATLNGDILTIPTIRFGDNVYTDLVLQLVDKTKLQFRMVSFNQM